LVNRNFDLNQTDEARRIAPLEQIERSLAGLFGSGG
jgi:hypothetical protein